jgi:molybdopterin converting factor small subunit
MADGVVEVHLFAAARAAVGSPLLLRRPALLSILLDEIEGAHPAFGAVRPRCSYLVDGTAVHEDVDLPAGSRLDVLPPFAGG